MTEKPMRKADTELLQQRKRGGLWVQCHPGGQGTDAPNPEFSDVCQGRVFKGET